MFIFPSDLAKLGIEVYFLKNLRKLEVLSLSCLPQACPGQKILCIFGRKSVIFFLRSFFKEKTFCPLLVLEFLFVRGNCLDFGFLGEVW